MRLAEIAKGLLSESYKLTYKDKKEIEKSLRDKYEKYKSDIEKRNERIRTAKTVMNFFTARGEEAAFKNSVYNLASKQSEEKPVLFNRFYKDNYESVKSEYVAYKERNSTTDFSYKTKKDISLKNSSYDDFYNNLSDVEKRQIDHFLELVGERVSSGTGESINRKEVRDAFFKTPTSFQKMFSEKPSSSLWRGDYTHPCNDEYDHDDVNYLKMQSFSENKNVAKEFGYHFNAKNIKTYSGSFSLPLYIKYGGDYYGFGDDEGEVLFFDVVYKCKKV